MRDRREEVELTSDKSLKEDEMIIALRVTIEVKKRYYWALSRQAQGMPLCARIFSTVSLKEGFT